MLSRFASIIVVVLSMMSGHALAGNYVLTIDGEEFEIDIGRAEVLRLADGRTLRVALDKKALVAFRVDNFSFDHSSVLSPSRTDLGDGVHQTMLASPRGTIIMIQEYASFDPSGLVDMMLNELTKEEVEYGYKIRKGDAVKTLEDGTQLTGKTAISSYKDDEYTRYVLAYRARDAGLLIVTQFEKESPPEDAQMIELFWKTLKITMK